MQFPSYIPKAVQAYIKEKIEGAQPPPGCTITGELLSKWLARNQGLESLLSKTRAQLTELDAMIVTTGQREELADLKEHREIVLLSMESLEARLSVLQRLVVDERMRLAFWHLTHDFADEMQWRVYFDAALEAQADYGLQRVALKRATKLKGEIAKAAEQLAVLLSEFIELGIDGPEPEAFFNPPGLFHRDSFEVVQYLEQREAEILAKSGLSLIDLESANLQQENNNPTQNELPEGFLNVLFKSSQCIRAQEDQRPSTIDIVRSIATAAQNYTPELYGTSAAVTQSRKNNRRTQYIRAFWHLMTNKQSHFKRKLKTPDLIHAMAITATVVLNGEDDDVGYDDVRKALEDRSKPTRENVPGRRKIRRTRKR